VTVRFSIVKVLGGETSSIGRTLEELEVYKRNLLPTGLPIVGAIVTIPGPHRSTGAIIGVPGSGIVVAFTNKRGLSQVVVAL
jgi:hypothetical protein